MQSSTRRICSLSSLPMYFLTLRLSMVLICSRSTIEVPLRHFTFSTRQCVCTKRRTLWSRGSMSKCRLWERRVNHLRFSAVSIAAAREKRERWLSRSGGLPPLRPRRRPLGVPVAGFLLAQAVITDLIRDGSRDGPGPVNAKPEDKQSSP